MLQDVIEDSFGVSVEEVWDLSGGLELARVDYLKNSFQLVLFSKLC
jgi:hypothetical protein